MITRYSNDALRRWNRGEFQVQLSVPHLDRPMGYCDGTEQDEQELLAIAEEEGVESLPIHKRILKTGRQIWMVGEPPTDDEDPDE